jgi:hypothetical protein
MNFQLSEGEIHYLWWFIQGSIMNPSTRWRLRKAWGFCNRHAWGFLQMEAAFRHGWMHGPAILYLDIMERAWEAINVGGPFPALRLERNLRPKGPCLMCEMGYGPESTGMAKPEVIQRGRDPFELKKFAIHTQPYWRKAVCGKCMNSGSSARCRGHLLEDFRSGSLEDLAAHQAWVRYLVNHLAVYAKSFRHGFHGTESDEDKAALISAVGWCSGWETLFALISFSDSDRALVFSDTELERAV